ncbi:hypothetical protein [Mucilaginibacter jinjuensis]|uniref:Tissue inhibitor of metalloproteinase n=1 Tax=Mucilaginibacter jinjuensis TaxID=1176721 RepID=A0ABY7T7I0_9SPHI|nr:hypothetical protein [Mucilaginibacter jinjuensis]WCT12228.1 hypothetical protein PQO05_26230 [Mucilaginibacter jinjuensis]
MKPIALLLIVLALAGCKSQKENRTKCGSVICTNEFVMIPVNVIATKSSQIEFKTYKVIDVATGKEVKNNGFAGKNSPNTIIVADDGHRKNFPEKGEDLQLLITRKDDRVVKVDYKISGGPCACHVSKLSGPDEVDLDQ